MLTQHSRTCGIWLVVLCALSLCTYSILAKSDPQEASPTNAFLTQLRNNWKSLRDDGDRGKHRFAHEAFINMAVMCNSQGRQVASKDLKQFERTRGVPDQPHKDYMSEYGNCLYNLADLLLEIPHVGSEVPEHMFKHSGLNKEEILERFGPSSPFMLLTRAAELGQPQAQHLLASAYATGVLHGGPGGLVPMDAGKAVLLEYMSALSGNPEAHMAMGYRYKYGIGVVESCERALQHYEFAANVAAGQILKRGHPVQLEQKYLSGLNDRGPPRPKSEDDPEVIAYLRQLSDEGDMSASLSLGKMYLNGNRVLDQDFQTAAKYLKRAGDAGSIPALGQLSYLLAQKLGGIVLSQFTDHEIYVMAKKSADMGDASGIMGLGCTYLHGIGVKMNHTKAFESFLLAQGKHSDSSFHLGEMLMGRAGNLESDDAISGLNAGPLPAGLQTPMDPNIVQLVVPSEDGGSETWEANTGVPDPRVAEEHAQAAKQIIDRLNDLTEEEKIVLRGINLLDPEAAKPRPGLGPSTLEKIQRAQAAAQHLNKLGEDIQKSMIEKAWKEKAEGRAKQVRKDRPLAPGEKRRRTKAERDHMRASDYAAAAMQYSAASQRGHILALHRLAFMTKGPINMGITTSCNTAMQGFKTVAERGDWSYDLTRALRAYDRRDRSSALRLFSKLAAIGYETAQYNAATVLTSFADGAWGVQVLTDIAQEIASTMLGRNAWGAASQSPKWEIPVDRTGAFFTKMEASEQNEAQLAVQKSFEGMGRSPHKAPLLTHRYSYHFLHPRRSLVALEAHQWPVASVQAETAEPQLKTGFAAGELMYKWGEYSLKDARPQRTSGISETANEIFSFQGLSDEVTSALRPNLNTDGNRGDSKKDCEERSLALYGLAALIGNAEARLRIGDFFYYGMGYLRSNKKEAAIRYQSAADQRNTHALFNLGLMHEIGDGVIRDFHLAKRFYDQAAEYNYDARIPRSVALAILQGHQYLESSEYGATVLNFLLELFWPQQDILQSAHGVVDLGSDGRDWRAQRTSSFETLQADVTQFLSDVWGGFQFVIMEAVAFPYRCVKYLTRTQFADYWLFVPRLCGRVAVCMFLATLRWLDPHIAEFLANILLEKGTEVKYTNSNNNMVVSFLNIFPPIAQIDADVADCAALILFSLGYLFVRLLRVHWLNHLDPVYRREFNARYGHVD